VRRFIQFHHLHHQIVQKYKDHPDSLQALVDGLKTREIPTRSTITSPSSSSPILKKGGSRATTSRLPLADPLRLRRPAGLPGTGQRHVDIQYRRDRPGRAGVLGHFDEIKARYLKQKREREQPSRVFRRLSERLLRKNGIDPDRWMTR